MTQNLWKILKSSTISIPRLLLLQYKNMKISEGGYVSDGIIEIYQ